jgi:hypothetical protein
VAAKYRYPLKRSPKSDPQQFRVYRMENEAIGARKYMQLTREVQQSLAHSVCRNYRVPRVKLEYVDLGRWAAEWGATPQTIRLNTKKGTSWDILTLTHELAHHVHHWLSDGAANGHESHGPEFMGCHMSILDTCRVIPVVGMRAVCEAWRVRYADPGTQNSLPRLKRVAMGLA